MLDYAEEPLDEVAFAVQREIAFALDLPVRLRRYHRFDASRPEALDEAVGVVTLVREDRFRLDLAGERLGLRDVVNLSRGEADGERVAEGVDDGVYLRRQSTARSTDGLVETPFFIAPALC
jgi:hypothetical protein